MAQQLENIKTAIRVYPGMQILEAAEIVGMLMSHFSARSEAGAILLDCVQSLEMAHDTEETYNEPEKPPRRSELERAFEFGASLDMLDNLQIRGVA